MGDYTVSDVQRATDAVYQGEYVCDGRRFLVENSGTIYEDMGSHRIAIGAKNGRTDRNVIAAILNAE